MTHDYQTRSKDSNPVAEEILNLKAELLASNNDIRDEIINLKNVIIKNLQEENNRLRNKVSHIENRIIELETKQNSLEQYGRLKQPGNHRNS